MGGSNGVYKLREPSALLLYLLYYTCGAFNRLFLLSRSHFILAAKWGSCVAPSEISKIRTPCPPMYAALLIHYSIFLF